MKHFLSSIIGIGLALSVTGTGVVHGQTQTPTLAAPTVFRMAGTLQTATGEPRTGVVVLVASLYTAQTDVTPLWSEAQTVTLDQTGHYSILVGSSLTDGVPREYFLSGSGRWLGVGVQDEAEQPRVMLVSVPYALKAVDADTLAGKTAADFVLAEDLGSSVRTALGSAPAPLAGSLLYGLAPMTSFSDVLTVTGFGTNTFSAGGTGANELRVENTTSGASNYSMLSTFAGTTHGQFYSFSQDYSTSGVAVAASALVAGDGAGGIGLAASDPSGAIRFYTGGTTERMRLSASGELSLTSLGRHVFSGSGTGPNELRVTNDLDGPGNYAMVSAFAGTTHGQLYAFPAGYSSSGVAIAGSALFAADGSGGFSLAAANASGVLRFYSGGTSERMRIDSAGNVGIGTSSPGAKLDVNGNINVSGNINAKYQDVAEWVETLTPVEAGTVVIVDPTAPNRVLASAKAYDTRVAGAVSKQPGLILGEAGTTKAMVAQSGRVRVKVDASYGAIRVGDLLVTSPTRGYAMRSRPMMIGGVAVHRAGTLLGKALEPLPRGKGEILVLLTLQ